MFDRIQPVATRGNHMRLRSITAALLTLLVGLTALLAAPGTASAAGDPQVSLSFSSTSPSYGAHVTVTATLGSPTTDRDLSIYVEDPGVSRQLVTSGPVDSSGHLAVSVAVYRNLTFTAEFAGDDAYDPQTVQRSLPVHARLLLTTASRSRSGAYYRYRTGQQPVVNMVVGAPNPGRCVSAVGQVYRSHAWRTFGSVSCLTLNSSSRTGVRFTGRYAPGTRLRVVAYFRGGTVNTYSAHRALYILFTR